MRVADDTFQGISECEWVKYISMRGVMFKVTRPLHIHRSFSFEYFPRECY